MSKLVKFFAASTILGAFIFSAANSSAKTTEVLDEKGSIEIHQMKVTDDKVVAVVAPVKVKAKKPKAHADAYAHHHVHPVCCHPKPLPKTLPPFKAGQIATISGDWGFALNNSHEFFVDKIVRHNTTHPISARPDSTLNIVIKPHHNDKNDFSATTFHPTRDYAFGGNLAWGFINEQGLEGNVELGYHQVKVNDNLHKRSSMESDIITGMVNGAYYATLNNSKIHPYVTAGVGLARVETSGVIIEDNNVENNHNHHHIVHHDDNHHNNNNHAKDINNSLRFCGLKAFKPAFQGGLGLSVSTSQATMFGIGYKFLGVMDIDQGDAHHIHATINGDKLDAHSVNLGTIRNHIHNVTVFAKMMI